MRLSPWWRVWVVGYLISWAPSMAETVDPGGGFEVEVTVENPGTEAVDDIGLEVVSAPSWLRSVEVSGGATWLGPGATTVYRVRFRVSDTAPVGRADELVLKVETPSDTFVRPRELKVRLDVEAPAGSSGPEPTLVFSDDFITASAQQEEPGDEPESAPGPYRPTRDEQVAALDCSAVAGAVAAWDEAFAAPRCQCADGLVLNEAGNACVSRRSRLTLPVLLRAEQRVLRGQWANVAGIPPQAEERGLSIRNGFLAHPGAGGPTEVVYEHDGTPSTLGGHAGVLDKIDYYGAMGSVEFRIVGDGRLLWSSGVVEQIAPSVPFTVSLAGVHELRLITTDGGNGTAADWAAWINLSLDGHGATSGAGASAPAGAVPPERPHSCQGGFAGSVVTVSRPGFVRGTYTGTYDQSRKGWFQLELVNGIWVGAFGEDGIGRRGVLENLEVTAQGFAGSWRVPENSRGSLNGQVIPSRSGRAACRAVAGASPGSEPPARPYSCRGGFAGSVITVSRPGFVRGTYTGTYDQSRKGWFQFQIVNGVWVGAFGEDGIGRRGELENLEVTTQGFAASWRVPEHSRGSLNGQVLPSRSGRVVCR